MKVDLWMGNAARCLKSAATLLADDDTNSACNRAYYAMHYAARAALIAKGEGRLAMAKTHQGLISGFSQHLIKSGALDIKLAGLLPLEANRRLVSDYQGDPLDAADAEASLCNAQVFVTAIAEWLSLQSSADPQI